MSRSQHSHTSQQGQPLTVQLTGDVDLSADPVYGEVLSEGTIYCLSQTDGQICPVADLVTEDWVTVLGIAQTGATLALAISVGGVQLA